MKTVWAVAAVGAIGGAVLLIAVIAPPWKASADPRPPRWQLTDT